MSMKKLLSRSLVLCAVAVSTFTAQADEGGLLGARYGGEDRGKPLRPAQVSAKWQQECSACHLAFPPGLLPAESWSKLVAGLDRHFGVDASLTPAEAGEVGTFLTSNASNRWSAKTAPLRITEIAPAQARDKAGRDVRQSLSANGPRHTAFPPPAAPRFHPSIARAPQGSARGARNDPPTHAPSTADP